MRYIRGVCRLSFLRWKTSLRIIMLLTVLTVLQVMYALPYMQNAAGYEYPLHIFETYIAVFSSAHASFLISIIVVFILADVPIRYKGFDLALTRGGLGKWLAAQWLYITICAFVLCAVILVFNVLISAPNAYLSNEWSLATMISSNSGKTSLGFGQLFSVIPKYIINNDLPLSAMVYTFLLQFMLFCFYGTLAVFVNLRSSRIIAPAILMVLNAIHWLTHMFIPGDDAFIVLSWLSPLYHGTYSEHQFYTISEGGMANAAVSGLILLILSIVFAVGSHIFVRRSDILNFSGGDFDE